MIDGVDQVRFARLPSGRWQWTAHDVTGREIGSGKAGGYAKIGQCQRNASALLGCVIELVPEGGRYTYGIAVGRGFAVTVSRGGGATVSDT